LKSYYKVQTYVPESQVQTLKDALNAVITPIFSGYDYVFATYKVDGNWRPLAGSQAYQGQIGHIEHATEIKLEFTILETDLKIVFATLKKNHPYEKPVIEAFSVILPN